MNEEKQIEEMAEAIGKFDCFDCDNCKCVVIESKGVDCIYYALAEHLIIANGYRKQSEGEWVDTGDFELDNIYSGWKCSLCGYIFFGNKTNFCSNCGAKMKGGAE